MSKDDSTELLLPEDLEHVEIDTFELEVVNGPMAGRTYRSTGVRTVLGTHQAADFFLRDSAVSRFHCEISMKDGRPQILDLDSRNGTFVDGVRIRSAYLNPSATIQLGETRIRFEAKAEQTRVPLSSEERFGFMVGQTPAIRAAFAALKSAAATDTTVLLHGEAGVGKDLAAASIHFESARREGPFVAVDCTAGPEGQVELQLFGSEVSEEGVRTGAGAFERAAGGTVYLDEVADLSDEAQSRLARVLETGKLQRPGAHGPIPLDVRVIASTRRNLRSEVNARRFRSELYLQLAVIDVPLPPLRERLEDIPVLVEQLLDTLGALDRPAGQQLLASEAIAKLREHSWPGNLRELRVYLERCVALTQLVPLAPGASPAAPTTLPEIDTSLPLSTGREQWVRYFERAYLERVLKEHDNNVSAAARAAGIDRAHFYRLMARTGMR